MSRTLSTYEIEWSIYWYETMIQLPEKRNRLPKYYDLCKNPNLIPAVVKKYPNHDWCWRTLSRNISINLDFILENMDKPWDWNEISANSAITFEDVISHQELPWSWNGLTFNKNMIEHISTHSYLPWNWKSLSINTLININLVLENVDKPWNWESLSINSAIKNADILNHPELPWREYYVNLERNLRSHEEEDDEDDEEEEDNPTTLEEYIEGLTEPLNYYALSYKPFLTFDFVLQNVDKSWSWNALSYHINITMKDIYTHPELPWNWNFVFLNKNITLEIIIAYIDHKYMPSPFDNLLTESKKSFIRTREREDAIKNLQILKNKFDEVPSEIFVFISDFL